MYTLRPWNPENDTNPSILLPNEKDSSFSSDSASVFDLTGSVTLLNRVAEFGSNYSEIYKGVWENIIVAVKVVRPVGTLQQTKRKLRRESETWWKLDHVNILPLYGFAEDFGSYGALVSPWCSRGSVGLYLRKSQVHPVERFRLWYGVLKGTNYLHSCTPPIIHVDLKPISSSSYHFICLI